MQARVTLNSNSAFSYRWLIFSILALAYVLVYFHRLCPAVLAVDLMRDLKAGGGLTGLLSAAYFYSYAIMQLPAGLLADSWGARKTITLFFAVACLGAVILGFSSSVLPAILGRTLVGIGVAMLFAPTLKILSEWFRVDEFAFMMGILMAMGGVGSLTAAAPLVWLKDVIGWRNVFLAIGLFTLFLGLMVWVFVRNRPSDFGWAGPEPLPEGRPSGEKKGTGLMGGAAIVLSTFHFWPLAIWFFCTCGVFFTLGGLWGGPYLLHVHRMEPAESGRVLSMIALGMVIGSPFLSHLSERVFKGRKSVLVFSSAFMILLMWVFAFFTDVIPRPGLYLLFFLVSVFSSAIVTIGFTANKELFPVAISGTSTGLINLFPFAGGALFQPIAGMILERYGSQAGIFNLAGYRAFFLFLLGAAVIAFIASFFIKETLSK